MIPSVPTWLNFRDGKDEGDGESESDMWDEEMKSEHYDSVEEEPGRKRSPITWVSRGNATWRDVPKAARILLKKEESFSFEEAVALLSNGLSEVLDEKFRIDILAFLIGLVCERQDDELKRVLCSLIPGNESLLLKDGDGCNAVQRACLNPFIFDGRASILFLEQLFKEDPNVINARVGKSLKSGTHLHIAVEKNVPLFVDWLIRNGADTSQLDDDGNTAWTIAFAKNNGLTLGILALGQLDGEGHWARTCGLLGVRKYAGLPDRVGASSGFQAIVVPANTRIMILALLALICSKKGLELTLEGKADQCFSFVNNHFMTHEVLSSRMLFREPTIVFGDRNTEADSESLPKRMSLVMPYFYSEPWGLVRKRRHVCTAKTIWESCLHVPLTLDEYCNPTLDGRTLDRRNRDQVVFRYALRCSTGHALHGEGENMKLQPATRLLMVHQLWVYQFEDVLIAAFPNIVLREPTIREALKHDSFSEVDGRLKAYECLSRVVVWLSGFIGLSDTSMGFSRPILDFYEESISAVSNDVAQYFGKPISEQEKAAFAEKQYLHDIADIREELSMIKSVVSQQELVWAETKTQLLSLYADEDTYKAKESGSRAPELRHAPRKDLAYYTKKSESWQKARAIRAVKETSSRLQKLKDRIDKADQDAERVQNLIPQYLELKRTYTTMKESHYAALLGAAVFGLSVVTIIFTPLSFAVALLAVPENSTIAGTINHGTVAKWTSATETISLLITALGTVLAWFIFRRKTELRGDTKKKKSAKRTKRANGAAIEPIDETSGESNVNVDDVSETTCGERASTRSEEAVVGDPSSSASNGLSKMRERPNDVEQGLGVQVEG